MEAIPLMSPKRTFRWWFELFDLSGLSAVIADAITTRLPHSHPRSVGAGCLKFFQLAGKRCR